MNNAVKAVRKNIHAEITDRIVEAIEKGAGTYEMPWHRKANAGMPRNPVTKNVYRGINTLVLWITGMQEGHASSQWASYQQWKSIGAQVREKEKGTPIVFYKRLESSEEAPECENPYRFVIRYSHVFNADQVEHPPKESQHPEADYLKVIRIEEFVKALGSDVRYGSDGAAYKSTSDIIVMPDRETFFATATGSAVERFYSVLLHEHIHWTGHSSRLVRDFSGKFGSESYAVEELVAELGAAFLCASLGLSTYPRQDHAAYLASWLKVLKEDKTAIFKASSEASKAVQFLEVLAEKNGSMDVKFFQSPI